MRRARGAVSIARTLTLSNITVDDNVHTDDGGTWAGATGVSVRFP